MRKNLKSKIQDPKSSGSRIHFSIGVGPATAFSLDNRPSGEVEVRRTGSAEVETTAVPADRWERFWGEMEKIGVWRWKEEYARKRGEGIVWELELVHNSRGLKAHGLNAYPETEDLEGEVHYPPGGQFDRFIQAIARLAGIPVDQIGSEPSDYD